MDFIGVPRLMLAITTFVFVVYLIPGLWGAPLKALSGYLPPMATHDFNVMESRAGAVTIDNQLGEIPKYADFLHFPHGIQGYFDYKQALAAAQKQGKPLFIDFTGHGCVNCREMEARVWSDPQVLQRLKEDFVMVALYIDERYELPESEWYVSDYDGKEKKTIGKQNADFQITKFNNNAQPYYVILDHKEELLVKPKAYDINIMNFVSFLEEAKAEFGRR
jgi:thiol:disulfide interchange protein DsbD